MKDETKETPQKSTSAKGPKPVMRSVDTYAAQCELCKKWRVIPTQEEYEEIRSEIPKTPFVCERKSGTSCDDPADIEYDATRTWVIDRPGIPKTPEGFKRSLVLRRDFSKMDAYYLTPTGKKLRSVNEIKAFIEANPQYKRASLSDFNFASPRVMEETIPEDAGRKVPAASSDGSSNKKTKMTRNAS